MIAASSCAPLCHQVAEKDVFFFPGSKNFIDFLRADGYGGVAKFCAPVVPKKGFQGFATRWTLLAISCTDFSRVVLQQAVVDPEEKKGKNKMVRVSFQNTCKQYGTQSDGRYTLV